MDLSLFYFGSDGLRSIEEGYRLLLDGARFADDHGFPAVWTPERHFPPVRWALPESRAVTGAAMAAVTRRVAIRAGSVIAPLHHPVRIAEECAVGDKISGGRVGRSFASAWHSADFALRPEAFQDRHRLLADTVEQVRTRWRGESLTARDGAELCEMHTYPRPVTDEVPVWTTSAGSIETFRMAGRMGADVLTHLLSQDLDDVAQKIAAYRAELPTSAASRGHVVLMVHTFLAAAEDEARSQVREPLKQAFAHLYESAGLFGTPDRARDTLKRFEAAEVDEVACLIDFGLPRPTVMRGLAQLAEVLFEARPAS